MVVSSLSYIVVGQKLICSSGCIRESSPIPGRMTRVMLDKRPRRISPFSFVFKVMGIFAAMSLCFNSIDTALLRLGSPGDLCYYPNSREVQLV